jgi:multicomponent Na+:H+ antiporter subunit C
MTWAVAMAVFACLAAGSYLLLARDLLRVVLGLVVLGGGANLLLFASGRLGAVAPPVIPPGATVLDAAAANPLPQALVLTAIVIGLALACFALVLLLRLSQVAGTSDALALRDAEPEPTDPVKPPRSADARGAA